MTRTIVKRLVYENTKEFPLFSNSTYPRVPPPLSPLSPPSLSPQRLLIFVRTLHSDALDFFLSPHLLDYWQGFVEEDELLNVLAFQTTPLLPIHIPSLRELALGCRRCCGDSEDITSDLGEVGADCLSLLPYLEGVIVFV